MPTPTVLRIAARLAACLAASLPALAADRGELAGASITVDSINYTSQQFDMGLFSSDWSQSRRWELNVLCEFPGERALPSGGGYLFWEERDWHGAARSSADYSCWGFGLQGGASLLLLPPERRTRLSLVPHLRGGIGFQDLTVTNVPVSTAGGVQTVDMSSGSGRVEVAAGLDLRLAVAQRLEFVFGGGADYWSAANVYVSAGTGGAGVGVVGNSYAFHGTDAFLRFGIGVRL